jgi:hypothetical protein
MPAARDAVWIDVLPNMSNFGPLMGRQLNQQASTAGTQAGQQFSGGFGNSLKGLAAMAGGALAAAGIGTFFKDAVVGASDLSETMNKSRVIFGEQAGAMEEWSRTAAKSSSCRPTSAPSTTCPRLT